MDNPRGNSRLERMHLTMGDMIRTVVYTETDWNSFILRICQSLSYALRLGVSLTIGHSPGKLSYHRDMMVPGRLLLDWDKINSSKLEASEKSNLQTNTKWTDHQYKPGDQVLLLLTSIRSKLTQPTLGPYTITHIHLHGTLRLDRGNYGDTVSVRNIKPFFHLMFCFSPSIVH